MHWLNDVNELLITVLKIRKKRTKIVKEKKKKTFNGNIPATLLSACSFCGLGSFAGGCGVSDFIDSVVSIGSFLYK